MRTACQADFVKVNLEWDETGQQTRLRRGLIEVEGVMPVLVLWLSLFLWHVKLIMQSIIRTSTKTSSQSGIDWFVVCLFLFIVFPRCKGWRSLLFETQPPWVGAAFGILNGMIFKRQCSRLLFNIFSCKTTPVYFRCKLRHQAFIIPPAVIESTSGEGIWSGMLKTQPIKLTGSEDWRLVCFDVSVMSKHEASFIFVGRTIWQLRPEIQHMQI